MMMNNKNDLIQLYKNTMKNILCKFKNEYENFELEEAIDYSINKRYRETPVKVHNNIKNQTMELDVLSLVNQLLNDQAVLTTQGVLFAKYGTIKNPFYHFVQYLLDKRDEAKTEMKKYPKGSELYNKYNLLQLNYKVACNALYGCCGQWSSIFYNLYLCTAVTGQGRGCISASITMFEGFLANNVKFESLTEVLTYIEYICSDIKNNKSPFNDYEILDRNINAEECFLRIFKLCGFKSWIPSDEAVKIIWDTIQNLNQKELNILYYKNNLYEFCKNSHISNLIISILINFDEPFLNPLKPPEKNVQQLDYLLNLFTEYIYYRHIYIDKLERVYTMKRDVTILTDTDSCIISLDEWYRFVLEKTIGIPMKIKYTQAQKKEAYDKVVWEFKQTELTNEYDFYNDKLVDKKRLEYPAVIIEEDNLRFSIINIISYILGKLILDYMDLFREQYNSNNPEKNRERILIMKNEFLFKSMLLTPGKKNYSTLQLLQEGNLIPEDKQFDIKGMPITKVGMPKSTSKQLSELLEYDVLRRSFIDQVDLIRKFVILEKKIYNSIKEKNKEYHKPSRIKSITSYDQPMRIQGIKASIAYNSIKDSEEEGINLEERNTVLIIKTIINLKNCDKIMNDFPDHFLRLQKLLQTKDYGGKIDSIAIPSNIKIPDWIIPFIDYNQIIHDNLKNFPLEVLGISKIDSGDITHTNIIKF